MEIIILIIAALLGLLFPTELFTSKGEQENERLERAEGKTGLIFSLLVIAVLWLIISG